MLSLTGRSGPTVEVAPDSIVRLCAQENYCEFVLMDRAATFRVLDEPHGSTGALGPDASVGSGESGTVSRLVRMTLAGALSQLPSELFVQTHRSHVANLRHVVEVVRRGRSCTLRLAGGASFRWPGRGWWRYGNVLPNTWRTLSRAGVGPS